MPAVRIFITHTPEDRAMRENASGMKFRLVSSSISATWLNG